MKYTPEEIAELLKERPNQPHYIRALIKKAVNAAVLAEREECAKVCDEMAQYWQDYKDTALLNGDVQLSNAASGEPRAAKSLAELIRAQGSVNTNRKKHGS